MFSHTQAEKREARLLTRQKVSQLLRPITPNPFLKLLVEEDWHPWSTTESQTLDLPLMRVWDSCSGSEPDENSRMLSRAPNKALNTAKSRKESLAIHLDHGEWTIPTPYISFTSSADALQELARKRDIKGNRGRQILTVIDPSTRISNCLPTLDVAAEMEHYSIPDPYCQGNRYYIHHYVCLWEVTPDEVVGHWCWYELSDLVNWYNEVIMPEFNRFRTEKRSGHTSPLHVTSSPAPVADEAPARDAAAASTFDMSALKESLLD